MVREHWVNLNGLWDLAITKGGDIDSATFDKEILVPFPVESVLSGVGLHVGEDDFIWYKRTFEKPEGDKVLLHFGAVDFDATVFVNGLEVGHHAGGYDPFTFDITEALSSLSAQELLVRVTDPSDAGSQPRGKQVLKPSGIYYTPNSGIWQTVWLEAVPAISIEKFVLEADPKTSLLTVDFKVRGNDKGVSYVVQVKVGGDVIAEGVNSASSKVSLTVPDLHLWSPNDPFLYDLHLAIKNSTGEVIDSVASYTAFRDISVQPDAEGIMRIFFNGKPCFMIGPLDQGFWPDGIYTAPTDEALKFDIVETKRLGFNMIRKHVKVEPARWYYWCDKLGIIVWQDMPSGDKSITPEEPDIERTPESAAQFEKELKAMIDAFRNHPSIVCWIPFNEGWGQYDTARITDFVRELDSTRIIDSTTGWADRGVGDMIDWHIYPGPEAPQPEAKRVSVLGEFGGLGLPIPGHMWQAEHWGYQSYKTEDELTEAFVESFHKVKLLISDPGLSAAIYTQTTDVETEANGLYTYDREILKMDAAVIQQAVLALIEGQ
jgi:beta-galactosidase/beta-glucuronidase